MRAALLVLALLLVPLASAQVPDDPAGLACDTVGDVDPTARDLLPLCARAEPQPPARHDHDATPPAPTAPAPVAPEDAEDLAADVTDEVQRIPEDPAGAADRLAAVVAHVVDFVRELLGLPGAGLHALQTTLLDARDAALDAVEAAREGLATAGERIADGARATVERVGALLDWLAPQKDAGHRGLAQEQVPDAAREVDGLLELPGRELGQVLAEGK